MCQMCDEYAAELRRMGIAMDEKVTVEFDGELIDALSRQAAAHGHDIETEVREIVRQNIVRRPPMTPEEFLARAREIRAMTPPGVIQSDSTLLIREDRDR